MRHAIAPAGRKSRVERVVLARVPVVLQADLYANSAFVGAAVLIIGRRLGISAALLAGAACLSLRLLSVHFGWQLPKIIDL